MGGLAIVSLMIRVEPPAKLLVHFIMMAFILFSLFIYPEVAWAHKVCVISQEPVYRWGLSGNIYVNSPVIYGIDYQKVVGFYCTREDERSFIELGHYWWPNYGPVAFVAWRDHPYAYQMDDIGRVTPGSYVNYMIYYDANARLHRLFMNGVHFANRIVTDMTSSVECTNAEKDVDAPQSRRDNLACFKDLRYMSSDGRWFRWSGVKLRRDEDFFYSIKVISQDHVDVIRDIFP